MRQGLTHGFPGFIAAGALTVALGAQTPGIDPAYVVRGRETVARQRTMHERVERFHALLTRELRRVAPDLLPGLEPAPSIAYGYQILPRMIPDAPQHALAKPQVVSYSWGWSDGLIARQLEALDRLEASLGSAAAPVERTRYEALVGDYKTVVDRKRTIDADVDYNWLWQKQIDTNRSLFDRLTRRLDDAVARHGRSDSVPNELEPASIGFDAPEFVRPDPPTNHQRVVTRPLSTDILDAGVVEAFKSAVETNWRARDGDNELLLRLTIDVIPPERLYCGGAGDERTQGAGCAPPATGEHVDLVKHVERFPKDRAVLTTGAPSLQLVAGRAIVLSPHDVAPRVLAHEFGHVLGFPDAYFRGYRDLGADGYQVLEFVSDFTDIMAAPGTGLVSARHFERLITAREIDSTMRSGLDALYTANDPVEAASRFRRVLEKNPSHYGATLQLAKALDTSGKNNEALAWWRKILEMADEAGDADTVRTARARLTSEQR